jgi:hypothetical protein
MSFTIQRTHDTLKNPGTVEPKKDIDKFAEFFKDKDEQETPPVVFPVAQAGKKGQSTGFCIQPAKSAGSIDRM